MIADFYLHHLAIHDQPTIRIQQGKPSKSKKVRSKQTYNRFSGNLDRESIQGLSGKTRLERIVARDLKIRCRQLSQEQQLQRD